MAGRVLHRVARLRVVAQRLVGSDLADAREVVGWMTCTQAQDFPGAVTSVALRSVTKNRADVMDALRAGDVVRSWPMRGTLHLVPARDLRWMLALTGARTLAAARTRRTALGIDEEMVGRARGVAERLLAERGRCTRAELVTAWDAAGLVQSVPQRAAHLLGQLAQAGVLALGPPEGAGQAIVLLDEWVPNPRRLGQEEAMAQWALRYFRSHGPAAVRDLAWWTGLTLTTVRRGVESVREQLSSIDADGTELLMDPDLPDRLAVHADEADEVLLLPGFDELLLGYQDRSASLAAAHRQQVVPGNNGMFLPTVVRSGQVLGTWRRPRSGTEVVATPFSRFSAEVRTGIQQRYAALP